MIISVVVDLPAPFGPSTATISPGAMVRSSPSTARTLPYDLCTPSRRMAGATPLWASRAGPSAPIGESVRTMTRFCVGGICGTSIVRHHLTVTGVIVAGAVAGREDEPDGTHH